ncbi:Uncharacterised protein [Escherichia coli]|uniref:Uncharacterized protein n=1 Tax=Escherichia coli TaxID=562 RepID=A0A376MDD9_ECOLX|nr:Uncharacterised protein [Escherichia coli]
MIAITGATGQLGHYVIESFDENGSCQPNSGYRS